MAGRAGQRESSVNTHFCLAYCTFGLAQALFVCCRKNHNNTLGFSIRRTGSKFCRQTVKARTRQSITHQSHSARTEIRRSCCLPPDCAACRVINASTTAESAVRDSLSSFLRPQKPTCWVSRCRHFQGTAGVLPVSAAGYVLVLPFIAAFPVSLLSFVFLSGCHVILSPISRPTPRL